MEFTFTAQKSSTAASLPTSNSSESSYGQTPQGFGSGLTPGTLPGPGNAFQNQAQGIATQPFCFSSTNSVPFFGNAAPAPAPIQPSMTSWTMNSYSDDSNPYDRTALTRAHGVGNTKRWRERLISHIEDRIKDKRIALNNARRKGLFSQESSQSSQQQEQPLSHSAVDASTLVAGQGEQLTGLGPGPGAEANGASVSQEVTNLVSTEDDRRLVAEVWETFKRENYESLVEAFQGMSDAEIESIEQDILQYQYSMQIDPSYEVEMEQEQEEMEQTIEQYVRLESMKSVEKQYDDPEIAAAILGCPGQLQIAHDEDTGLLIMCSQCELLA
ncbi:hypothetical protein BGW38_003750 [Lunasporangiospora selenospora]|uniref:Uncharacterized protein n=1 Tax=Lunasporangiospora selenospora TaxID=979761 RepID=A0A9P6FSB9_9FUNG|nr:hypothetical protein BGW38_003750 [Lunasporangiospora selenospora]